jgi:hypothetical protein
VAIYVAIYVSIYVAILFAFLGILGAESEPYDNLMMEITIPI